MRDSYFDNSKALLIIFVVLGHLVERMAIDSSQLLQATWISIYSFHMPAFIFISGYFSKRSSGYKNLLKTLSLYMICTILFLPFHNATLIESILIPYWLLWYLIGLFVWRTITGVIEAIPPKITIPISFLLGILSGYFEIPFIFALPKIIYFFPFYLLGFFYGEKIVNTIKVKSKLRVILLSIIYVAIVLLLLNSGINRRLVLASHAYARFQFTAWYSGILHITTYFLNIVSASLFFSLVPIVELKWTWIGRKTLPIYILHGLIILLVSSFVSI